MVRLAGLDFPREWACADKGIASKLVLPEEQLLGELERQLIPRPECQMQDSETIL